MFVRFSTLAEGAVLDQMVGAVEHKLAYVADGPTGWVDLLVRAVLCNFCINLAMLLVYNGLIKEDLTKSLVMIVAVFIFAFLGLEHSVANTVLFSIVGLREGLDLGARGRQRRPRADRQLPGRRAAHRPVLRVRQRRLALAQGAPAGGLRTRA